MTTTRIALIGAMPQEIEAYKKLANNNIYVGLVGISKPIAALNTTKIILDSNPDFLIFTGVAGAISEEYKLGDLVIGSYAIDADLDVTVWKESPQAPKYKRGEQPFTRQRVYTSDQRLVNLVLDYNKNIKQAFVATGSAFLDQKKKTEFLEKINPQLSETLEGKLKTPDVYDMETSAVLQVANHFNKPAIVIRAISDTLEGNAPEDFNKFINNSVEQYVGLVKYLLRQL
ncbi:5'-methylthioadenosine/S-adenosylhomocysteine nucleosidase [Candidatus Woesearchaeota archaeon]|nr:5'-methylthioadenosine/S-adenosylhomocysteine nucleosidase [Candidatus Woesearchaeota archaeon]